MLIHTHHQRHEITTPSTAQPPVAQAQTHTARRAGHRIP
jgi:hypothetical protein